MYSYFLLNGKTHLLGFELQYIFRLLVLPLKQTELNIQSNYFFLLSFFNVLNFYIQKKENSQNPLQFLFMDKINCVYFAVKVLENCQKPLQYFPPKLLKLLFGNEW